MEGKKKILDGHRAFGEKTSEVGSCMIHFVNLSVQLIYILTSIFYYQLYSLKYYFSLDADKTGN